MSSRKREVISFEGATVQVIKSMEVMDGDLLFISSPTKMEQAVMDRATAILKKAIGSKITVLFIHGEIKIEGVVRYVESDDDVPIGTPADLPVLIPADAPELHSLQAVEQESIAGGA